MVLILHLILTNKVTFQFMNTIVYLAHTKQSYIDECRFSLIRFLSVYNLQPPPDIKIVVVTDRPSFFELFTSHFLNFKIIEISTGQIKEWSRNYQYVYRIKLKVLQDIQHDGNLLFFDTDTYILGPLQPLLKTIASGTAYMHQKEGTLDSASFYKWKRFLQNNAVAYGNKTMQYDDSIEIWNSGVVGLPQQYKPLLTEALHLTDALFTKFPKHIAEQVALSYCLQGATSIHAANNYVAHYWHLKEFSLLLSRFFKTNSEESVANLVKLSHHINAMAIQADKEAFQHLPVWKRWVQTVTGNGWRIDKYEKKFSP